MSLFQEYEEARKFIGAKKYDAIETYLDQNDSKGEKRIFLDDVLYKRDEWDKFEKWYNENKHLFKDKKERGAR